MTKKTYARLCLLFGITLSWFLAHTFQHPVYVSKRVLLVSLAVGLGAALIAYFLYARHARQWKMAPSRLRQLAFASGIAALVFVLLVGYQPATLLTPAVEVDLVFHITPGLKQPIASLAGISAGGRYFALRETLTTQTGALITDNKDIAITPDENCSAVLHFYGRTWGNRVHFFFENATDNFTIDFLTSGAKDTYNYQSGTGEADFSTSVKTPPAYLNHALSFILFSLSLYLSILLPSLLIAGLLDGEEKILPFITLAAQLFFIAAMVIAKLYLFSPKFLVQSIDSYLFHFFGRGILEGKVIYRDLWDHKGPLIFFLNALGHFLKSDLWGVWWLELVFAFSSTLILAKMFFKKLGGFIILPLVLFISGVTRRFQGGNFTEEYALLFYLLAFYCYWLYIQKQHKTHLLFIIGVCAGLSFMLRANLISPFVAIGLGMVFEGISSKNHWQTLKKIAVLLTGFLLVSTVFILYFAANGALFDFFNAAFFYNFLYTQRSVLSLTNRISFVIEIFPLYMMLIAACLGIVCFVSCRKESVFSRVDKNFIIVIVIGFAIELMLYNLSGNNFFHYMLPLVPYEIFILSFFLYLIISSANNIGSLWQNAAALLPVLMVILAAGFLGNLNEAYNQTPPSQSGSFQELKDHITDIDSLLMWGYGLDFNYELHADSPSRYIFQYPLANCAFVNESMIRELVASINTAQPVIVDTHKMGPGYALDHAARTQGGYCPPFAVFFDYFDAHYQKFISLSNGYLVYKHR